jgi:orotate phosphoribosyltransferase
LAERIVARQPFTTGGRADGRLLSDYFDGHRLMGDPYLLTELAGELCREVRHAGADAVAGEISAGSSLATAVSLASVHAGPPLEARGIRATAKEYGVSGLLTSPLPAGTRVAMLDDVVSTGAALLRSAAALRTAGCDVVGAYVILERDPGIRTLLAGHGIPLCALFSLDELRRVRAGVEPAQDTSVVYNRGPAEKDNACQ